MKEIVDKYKFIFFLVFCAILFFSTKSCVNRQANELRGKNEQLKDQVEKLQDGVKVSEQNRLRLKDSIKSEDIKKEQKLKKLSEKVNSSENKVKELQITAQKDKKKIKNMSLVAVADTLNVIYGGKNAVANENSIDIKGSLPYQVLETVVDANVAQDIIKEKDLQLTSKDSVILIKDSQLKNSSILLTSTESSLNSHKELNRLQSDLNKSLEKENSKIRAKNTLNKILIPVAVTVGVLIGNKVAKNK